MKIGTDYNDQIPRLIPDEDRDRHLYLVGMTGTGKSTLIENMIAQDLASDECVVLIDPHGVTSETVVRHIPEHRDDHLIYVRPSLLSSPVSINLFADIAPDDRPGQAGDIVAAFVDYFGDRAVSDRSEQVLRNAILALMETPGTTLLAVIPFLRDEIYRANILIKVTDPLVLSYWFGEFDFYREEKKADVVGPILNKLDALFSYPAIRHILGQSTSTVNLDEVFNRKQILIFNLYGLADGVDSVFGALMVSLIWSTIRRRGGRSRVRLYIDEFPRIATKSIAPILSEARKMRLELTLGHQYWGQVSEDIQKAVYGNVGTLISFRVGAIDAPLIAKQFDKTEEQLKDLPNYRAYIRPTPPASSVLFATDQPRTPLRPAAALITNSLNHFGRPRSEAEKQVKDLFTG